VCVCVCPTERRAARTEGLSIVWLVVAVAVALVEGGLCLRVRDGKSLAG